MNEPIYHLASLSDSEKLQNTGSYSAPSLATEGFIHCCTSTQLPGVIQRYYIDATKLALFRINTKQLEHDLVYENTTGGTEQFPHIYGEINVAAVVETTIIDQTEIARIAASKTYQP